MATTPITVNIDVRIADLITQQVAALGMASPDNFVEYCIANNLTVPLPQGYTLPATTFSGTVNF